MANIFEPKQRNVIPGWRSFNDTLDLGELNSLRNQSQQTSGNRQNIDDYIFSFKQNNSIAHAGELISAAASNNQLDIHEVKNAAKLIIDKHDEATHAQKNLQKKYIKITLYIVIQLVLQFYRYLNLALMIIVNK